MLKELLSAEFDEAVKDGSVVVDFWAPWCPTCRMMLPNLELISNDYDGKVNFYKFDITTDESFAKSKDVLSLPTLLFYKNGELVEKTTGFKQKVQINNIINQIL